MEPAAKFKKWFRTKLKEAQRLETQLAGRFPRGRDLNGTAFLNALEIATKNEPQDNQELMLWQSQILRDPSSLPHPIVFNSNTDLRWFKLYRRQYQCKQTATGESIETIELTQRLFVEFNGLTKGSNYIFEVNCDDRQIDRFQQFLNDDRLLRNSSSDEEYSSSLFTLRSAHLLWVRKKSQDRHRRHTLSTQTADEPWNTNQLYLHCSLETKSLTAEGMREIQQQKIQKVNNTLTKQSKNTNPSIGQQQSQRKNQTSQSLLDRPLPRPSRPKYQGNPQIIVGLIFDPVKPIYLAVVDATTGKTIICRSTRQLLGDKYPKLSEYRLKQQQNIHHRRKQNQHGQFHQLTESTQGEYLNRILAKAVIKVAQEFKASSIALPPMDNKIEKIQSELEAYAEEETPEDIGTQKKLTRKTSVGIHKWSYHQLSEYISSNAAKLDITVERGSLSSLGTPPQQAAAIAISAYNSRNHSTERSI
ncbi:MAG: type V CRISPR-associated protein Cas12k [Chamaesiphon sp.]|nr:type V CRISPR-associated protein Cas12k [Chamaesiphon sp.]